ncbi:MAG: DUF6764 family protein [Candidatus Nanopelagicales bacterium]
MKMLGYVAGAVLAVGCTALCPGQAVASPLQCISTGDQKLTVIEGGTACGSEAVANGAAAAYGIDGIVYAKAIGGATALGLGVSGGVGASEGVGGVPIAIGLGPGSVAIVSVDYGAMSLAVAFPGSQALVANSDQGVVCAGGAAFAWNMLAGKACIATGAGILALG